MEASMERLQELTAQHQAIVEDSIGRLNAAMEQFRAIVSWSPGQASGGELQALREKASRLLAELESRQRHSKAV